MKTLEDAWQWYLDAQRALYRIHRLGDKHWLNLPWKDNSFSLLQDDHFRLLEDGWNLPGRLAKAGNPQFSTFFPVK